MNIGGSTGGRWQVVCRIWERITDGIGIPDTGADDFSPHLTRTTYILPAGTDHLILEVRHED